MEMPQIKTCDAIACAYNDDQQCRALAITVGGGDTARCDTYFGEAQTGGFPQANAGVGACRAVQCKHNERLECTATNVDIGQRQGKVTCLTFAV